MRAALFLLTLVWLSPPALSTSYTFYGFEYAPFSMAGDDDQNRGPYADLIRAFCQQQAYDCQVYYVPWRRAEKTARESDTLHGLFPLSKNAEREEWLYYSKPFLTTGRGFYTLGNAQEINSLDDFEGHTITTFGPSNTARIMAKHLEAVDDVSISLETSMDISVTKFIHGRYGAKSALYGNIDVVQYLLEQQDFAGAKLAYITKKYTLFLTFPRHTTSAALVDEFNAFIDQYMASGQMTELLEVYHLQLH